MENKRHVIVAPHADDEIVGCHAILLAGQVHTVVFPNRDIGEEAKVSSENFDFQIKVFDWNIIGPDLFNLGVFARECGGNIFFPDPVYEWHPDHRKWGAVGEGLLRQGLHNVMFYSVNMTAPYIRKVGRIDSERKQKHLNMCYHSKKDLWKYDHKYFLFEGHCQWLTTWKLCHA